MDRVTRSAHRSWSGLGQREIDRRIAELGARFHREPANAVKVTYVEPWSLRPRPSRAPAPARKT